MGKPEPSLFDDEDEATEAAADAEADADVAAGRVVSHEAVKRWLLTWGKGPKVPPPKCGE